MNHETLKDTLKKYQALKSHLESLKTPDVKNQEIENAIAKLGDSLYWVTHAINVAIVSDLEDPTPEAVADTLPAEEAVAPAKKKK